MKTRKIQGFTLIELLIVVAIISVLTAIVLSSVSSSQEKSRAAAATKILKSILPELSMCSNDNGFSIVNLTPVEGSTCICKTNEFLIGICKTGYSQNWPKISSTGWAYSTTSGHLNSGYTYKATRTISGSIVGTITCTLVENSCVYSSS